MRQRCRRGFTVVDLMASTVSGVLILGLASAALGGGNGALTRNLTLRDATNLKQMHQAMVLFARNLDGTMPRPGLIDRQPTDISGVMRDIPGRGEEDRRANTTANLYSCMIMQNYFQPDLVVSPVERNPRVKPKVRDDYDWNQYDPVNDVYWDYGFVADLAKLSNASYAHQVLWGARLESWSPKAASDWPLLGNRGPRDGEPDARSYTCGPHGHWAGNVVFGDGQVTMLTATAAPKLTIRNAQSEPAPDNIFAMETGPDGTDAILAITRTITETGPELQFD